MTREVVAAVDLNGPGRYLHWSVFTVSLANLVLIAVMVLIFAAALLLPFPGRSGGDEESQGPLIDDPVTSGAEVAAGARSPYPSTAISEADQTWTGAVRRAGLRTLPPGKLLPGRQPAYVASWIYVFGVASLAALAIAIGSGFAIALGGPDWWHTNPVGHFFNSLHLWSVEMFMAFIVIHLWGKFWMAAWRGRRALTWMTGVVAFVASVIECFTGYVSQQNFDSQWISTSGKDAINTTGLGGFFNLLNFGQMLLWHVVLLPVVLVAVVGAHVLLVRVRGVSHPLPVPRAGPGRPPPGGGGRQRRLDRPHPRLRHRKRGGHSHGHRHRPGLYLGRRSVVSGRAGGEPGHVGEVGPGGFHGHRRQRAERDERDGYVRPAVQQRHRQRPGHRDLVAATGRGQDTHRHGH